MDNNVFINRLVEEGAKKALPHPLMQTVLWLGATMIYLSFVLNHAGIRSDIFEKITQVRYAAELVLLLAGAIMAAFTSICFSRPDGYQINGLLIKTFSILLIWVVVAFTGNPDLNWSIMSQASQNVAYDCMKCIAVMAVPPGIGIFLMVRKGMPTHFYRAGLMGSLSVTVFAYLCMRLIEPTDNPGHLILWHAMPVAVLCLLGTILARLTLRWK